MEYLRCLRGGRAARRTCVMLFVSMSVVLGGCAKNLDSHMSASPASGEAPPQFNLGTHTRKVTTSSPEAQKYFNQGLVWAYSFNHDEAIRNFKAASRLDPKCAMAWWGIALCNGPHINNPAMDAERTSAACENIEIALDVINRPGSGVVYTDAERGLIEALRSRYVPCNAMNGKPPLTPEDRAPLDRAYADAMSRLLATHPGDVDIATLYAESLMDLRPWDLWGQDGTPRPETEEIVRTLEAVLAAQPDHPGANHLYIHAVEASKQPERANGAAGRLRNLVPDSGHMVHMPSHIDVRTGRWAMAADTNARAIEVDRAYRARSPRQGFYRVYMMHDHHFLAYACMMEGRSKDAIAAARESVKSVPQDWLKDNGAIIDGYMPIAIETLMRFGKWDELLVEPAPAENLPITTAFWRMSRAVAYAAKGDVSAARAEQARFREQVSRVPKDAHMAINPAHTVLSIGDHLVEGEIAYREGDVNSAVNHLREAAGIEDTLKYMEPPDWVQPVRHTLGAILLQAGRTQEAEQVYREDLARWPENGWSLLGLAKCLKVRNAPAAETAAMEERFRKAWARADIKAETSCLCVSGGKK